MTESTEQPAPAPGSPAEDPATPPFVETPAEGAPAEAPATKFPDPANPYAVMSLQSAYAAAVKACAGDAQGSADAYSFSIAEYNKERNATIGELLEPSRRFDGEILHAAYRAGHFRTVGNHDAAAQCETAAQSGLARVVGMSHSASASPQTGDSVAPPEHADTSTAPEYQPGELEQMRDRAFTMSIVHGAHAQRSAALAQLSKACQGVIDAYTQRM